MTPSLSALIDRLAQATGPDRKLDRDIAAALGPVSTYRLATCPEYTKSVDAALTQVPEGWSVETLRQRQDKKWDCCLILWRDPRHASLTAWGDEAHTAPLSVCLASLRAIDSGSDR